MFELIVGNLATIVVGAGVVILVGGIIAKMLKDKREGKNSCSGGCANCPRARIEQQSK